MESHNLTHPPNSNHKFMYSPRLFMQDIEKLITQLQSEHFDAILAVARGGLIPGSMLANRLKIPLIYSIQIKSYCDQAQTEISICSEPHWADLQNKRILVVDDLIDEGKTIDCLIKLLKSHQITQYRIAVLIDKQKTSLVTPDYYSRVVKSWIAFFWEADYRESGD